MVGDIGIFNRVIFVAIWIHVGLSRGLSPWCDPLTLVPLCDHVPDWQPRILLGMVEARSVNVKNTTSIPLVVTNRSMVDNPVILGVGINY